MRPSHQWPHFHSLSIQRCSTELGNSVPALVNRGILANAAGSIAEGKLWGGVISGVESRHGARAGSALCAPCCLLLLVATHPVPSADTLAYVMLPAWRKKSLSALQRMERLGGWGSVGHMCCAVVMLGVQMPARQQQCVHKQLLGDNNTAGSVAAARQCPPVARWW
jgi:hypothetical protein